MDAWISIELPPLVWGLLAAAVVLAALAGGPTLLSGGSRRRRRMGRRGGYRIRTGPGAGTMLVVALARRVDTVALAAVTAAFVVVLVLNARAGGGL